MTTSRTSIRTHLARGAVGLLCAATVLAGSVSRAAAEDGTQPAPVDPTPVAATTDAGGASVADVQAAPLPAAAVAPWIVQYAQKAGSTVVTVTVPDAATLIGSKLADSVTVTLAMSYGGTVTKSVSITKALTATTSFTLDATTYGKFTATAQFTLKGTAVRTNAGTTVGVVANEYNIGALSGTLPVVFFSLSLWGAGDIRHDAAGNLIPTIVYLERPSSWNWNSLPQGLYGLPYLTQAQLTIQPGSPSAAGKQFMAFGPALAAYVKDLKALSPNATFHLYCADYYLGYIMDVLYANGITDAQSTVTVLSDGAFSYAAFSGVYASANPQSTHTTRSNAWLAAKATTLSTGTVPSNFTLNLPRYSTYAAVDATPNAQYWVARKSLLTSGGDNNAFGLAAQANPKVVNFAIAAHLAAIQAQGATAIGQFKALYNFSDQYFAEAAQNGKKVMMFLGTQIPSEVGLFPDYARFVMGYYGNAYQYYYKGHPATPTDLNPSKQDEEARLGITDVDSSIAAELILFFNPSIYLSGYPSSTYASVTNPAMADALFGLTKAAALANTTADYSMMDVFISPVGATTPSAIASLCRPQQRCYMVEPSAAESKAKGYDLGIWEPDIDYTRYYTLVGGTYTLVSQHLGGQVTEIVPKALPTQSVMIDGTMAGAAWWRLSNYAPDQRFRMTDVGGYYTFEQVTSGLILGTPAGAAAGTVVRADVPDGKADQTWRSVATGDGDGSVYLVNKDSGLYMAVGTASLVVATGNKSTAQKFFLRTVPAPVADGAYIISSAVNPAYVLDVPNSSTARGTALQTYLGNGSDAQKFQVTLDPWSGYYTLINLNSHLAVDVRNGSMALGALIQQYTPNGTPAQQWAITAGTGGYVLHTALGTRYVMDLKRAQAVNGGVVQTYTANGTPAQSWGFTPTHATGTPWPPMSQFTLGADMTGDGRGETLAVDRSGVLWLYPGTATGALGTPCQLGTGFGNVQVFGPGDLNSDGKADVLGITADGNLWMYPGNGCGKLGARVPVGSGWTGWTLVPSGDLNGDNKADLLGINAKGDLFMYAGKGTGLFQTRVQVGSGWTGWQLHAAGDLNKDGKADILGINAKGDLYQYLGKGTGTFNPRQQAGSGWLGNVLASGADLNGDGLADILGRNDTSRALYYYQGMGSAHFATRVQIATGW